MKSPGICGVDELLESREEEQQSEEEAGTMETSVCNSSLCSNIAGSLEDGPSIPPPRDLKDDDSRWKICDLEKIS